MQQETIKDTLRRWSVAFTDTGMPFDYEATTANEAEFFEMHRLVLKAQGWLKSKGFYASSEAKQWEFVKISCLQYRFKLRYKKPAHINQKDTAIAAYHTIDFDSVRGKVAQVIFDATKAGQDITRNEIEQALSMRSNTVTGRVKELLDDTVQAPVRIDGEDWRLIEGEKRISKASGEMNRPLVFVKWQPISTPQQTLF